MEIVARGVAVGHAGVPVLSGIDLTLRPGELVGLLGPNGAGKTTLLRTLAGLAPPLAGRILYDGDDAATLGGRALARRLAYLAQGGEVNWSLAAETLVALGRLPHRRAFGGPRETDRDAVARALARADASHLAGRSVATLSGGERARVLLARALAVEGEMLLADEPVAALDPRHQLRSLELLRAVARHGTGVVVILHDLMQAARFCDRVIVVSGGRMVCDGRPDDVLVDEVLAGSYGVAAERVTVHGLFLPLPWRPLSPTEGGPSEIAP